MTDGQARPESGPSLGSLVRRVRDARASVESCRHGHATHQELESARHELMRALQDYTSALERHALPVPPRLRAELKLHRDVFGR